MKHISIGGLDVSRIGLGTMAMSGYYLDPTSSDAESIRTIHRALELGVTHIDTAEIYGPYANEELVGRALEGASRRGRGGDEVRLRLALRRRPRSARQQPGEHPDRGRGLAEAARHRPHRPLLPAPGRPEHAHRGHRRRRWPSWWPRARSATSACPRPRRRRSAAPTPCTRSPRSRPSTRCGPATRRPSCCRYCASWASASCPTRRSGTASSQGRSAPPTTSPTTTGARPTRASPRATSSRTSASSTRSSRRHRGRRHPGADRARLAARAGRRHRPDPRHQARLPRRGEHGRRRYRAEPTSRSNGSTSSPRPPVSATRRRRCP